jgi:hypothetical protein
MKEAGFFDALVPVSRNYTRCDFPLLVPTAVRNLNTAFMKYLLTLTVQH